MHCSQQNTPQDGKEVAVGGLGRVVGVGVDIDQSALSAASGNAARASLTGVCRWACHDFAQLADERVRQDLASAVSACEESAQSNDHTAPVKMSIDDSVAQSNGFTVPVKSSAAQSNVSASSLPLLAPHGCIIFQGTIDDPSFLRLNLTIYLCPHHATMHTVIIIYPTN